MHYEKFADGTVKCIEDEIPFDVPEGWEWCRCRNIVDLFSGQDLEPQRYNSNGVGIPYITGASNLSGGHVIINRWTETPTTYATINDLLLTCKGSGVGKMAICDIEDAHIARQIMALRCTSAICLSYLQVLMSAFITEITYQANGIIPGIRREIVLETLFPLPPYNEQIQIGDRCSALTDLVLSVDMDQAEMLSLVGNIKAKILDLAIRGKLVPQNPNDEPASILLDRIRAEKEELIKQGKIKRDRRESVIFRGEDNSYYEKIGEKVRCIDDSIPFDLPDGWEWCNLSIIGDTNIGLTYQPSDIVPDGIMVLRSNNIINDHIDLADLVQVNTNIRDNQYVRKNDILICARNGSKALVGKCAVLPALDEPASFGAFMAIYRTEFYEYIFYYLRSKLFRGVFDNANSTAINQLTQDMLKRAIVPLPPYEEQKRISSSINTLFHKLSCIEDNLR